MSALVFSHYHITGNEGAAFDVGNRPQLDEFDGFYDQALATTKSGDRLVVLVNDGQLTPKTTTCRELRGVLDQTPIVTGHIDRDCVWPGDHPLLFHIDDRMSFREMVQRKPAPMENECIAEVGRIGRIWESVRQVKETNPDYTFGFVCRLPTVASIRRSHEHGMLCVPQLDFGLRRPSPRGFPLLVEPSFDGQCVRVIVLGSNDVDSCRVFDVTDVDQYCDELRRVRRAATLPEEISCWDHLLK